MENNSILMKNEIEANKFASIVMVCTNLFVVIVIMIVAQRYNHNYYSME